MWKTAILLIFTLLVVPVIAFKIDVAPTDLQKSTMIDLVMIYVIVSCLCFVISSLTKNYSQVDKLWSILPIIYVWIVCTKSDFEPRILMMAILVTIWGLRLSFNFARRGGYQWRFWEGEEDYRWAILMDKPEFKAPWKWILFNFLFISFYQLGLILLFTLPIVKSMQGQALGLFDYLLFASIIAFIIIETIADQQQWIFQKEKRQVQHQKQLLSGDFKNGFLSSGLWGFVRHPNYAAEQMIWILFYLFSVAATGIWINWSITGCLLLLFLFKGSSDFSEAISVGKYSEYQEYQKRVPRFLPHLKTLFSAKK